MGIYSLLLPVVVGIAIFQPGLSLVCYDNVANDEKAVVLLDCSYHGAVCAVTNKTTTRTISGIDGKFFNFSDSVLLYHCAQKSCHKGPMAHCKNTNKQETVKCSTQCCDSDKCNMPTKSSITVKTVSAKDALSCYQLVENRGEKVKCLFEGASCLSMEFESTFSGLLPESKHDLQTQFCATKTTCSTRKIFCDSYGSTGDPSFSLTDPKTCSVKCCNHDYCNTLSTKYNDDNTDEANNGYYEHDARGSSSGALHAGWIVAIVVSICFMLVSIWCKATRWRRTTATYTPAPNS